MLARIGWVWLLLIAVFSTARVAAEEYVIGPGDVVNIRVYEHDDLTTTARINDSGKITFWLLGDVPLAGLTTSKAESTLARLLLSGGYIKNPQVSVSVTEYRSQQVSVLGSVSKPGRYPINENTSSLLDLLAEAGGLREDASTQLVLIRKDKNQQAGEKIPVDLLGLLAGDLRLDIKMMAGDVLFAPKLEQFYIYGEVQHPGMFRLERNMTVMQALSVGGGLTAKGTQRGVVINRREGGGDGKVREIKVDLSETVLPNDVVYVKESLF